MNRETLVKVVDKMRSAASRLGMDPAHLDTSDLVGGPEEFVADVIAFVYVQAYTAAKVDLRDWLSRCEANTQGYYSEEHIYFARSFRLASEQIVREETGLALDELEALVHAIGGSSAGDA